MKTLLILSLVALLSSCANPASEFYLGIPDARQSPIYEYQEGPVQILTSNDLDKDIHDLEAKSYWLCGVTSVNGPSKGGFEDYVREHAEKIGAHIVLLRSEDAGTQTVERVIMYRGVNNLPLEFIVPHPQDRTNFTALFFAKVKTKLGVAVSRINDKTKEHLGTNEGVILNLVFAGSPADAAGLLPGDVLLYVDDDLVQSPEQFVNILVPKYKGQTVVMKIDRGGKAIERSVRFP